MGGGLCAAVGVLAFAPTTMPRVVAAAVCFVIGAMMGFAVGGWFYAGRAVVRSDGTLDADAVVRLLIAWGLVAVGVVALALHGWDLKIALVTLAFLVAALVCTVCRGAREGPPS